MIVVVVTTSGRSKGMQCRTCALPVSLCPNPEVTDFDSYSIRDNLAWLYLFPWETRKYSPAEQS